MAYGFGGGGGGRARQDPGRGPLGQWRAGAFAARQPPSAGVGQRKSDGPMGARGLLALNHRPGDAFAGPLPKSQWDVPSAVYTGPTAGADRHTGREAPHPPGTRTDEAHA